MLYFYNMLGCLTSLPHDTAVHTWCQLETTIQKVEASSFLKMLLCISELQYGEASVCVCACVCLAVWLLCQAREGVRNSSTDLGIKLMCWDQGPAPRKLSLWLKAIIRMGGGWALAPAMAQKPNTCQSPVPGPINTYISIYPMSPPVVISVINNGPRWWD